MGRRPLELEHQHLLVAHAACAAEDGLDGGVERLDHAEAHRVVAIGSDPFEVTEEELAQLLHLGKTLPPQRALPALEEEGHATARLVRPQPVKLLTQDVRLVEATVGVEELLQLAPLGAAHVAPAVQQQPALAAAVLAHDRAGPKELLSAHLVDGVGGVLQDMELVEDDGRVRQDLRHRVQVGAVHVDADRLDCRPLVAIEAVAEKRFERVLGPVSGEPDDLAAHEVGQHGPVLLPLPALDLVGAQMTRSTAWPTRLPLTQEGLLRSAGLAPADAPAHSGVAGRHRLAVDPDLLPQPPSDARQGVGERHSLDADPTPPAANAAQRVHQRHRMLRPGQVAPAPVLRVTHPRAPAAAPSAGVAPSPTPLDANPDASSRPFLLELQGFHAETVQPQELGKLPQRSHSVLPCSSKPREDTTGMVRWRVGSPVTASADCSRSVTGWYTSATSPSSPFGRLRRFASRRLDGPFAEVWGAGSDEGRSLRRTRSR